jgi:uncharacterized protein (TIGR02147 family)
MISIFQYTNYRTYLKDLFKEKKDKEKFTYRKFAELAGVNSSSWLLLLIKGKKNLTSDSAIRISRALGHTPEETEYFENLVHFTQAKTVESKNYFFTQLADIKKKSCKKDRLNVKFITEDQYEYYNKWYHPVIRSLVTKVNFKDNYGLLGKQLIPVITASQARKSVELLVRLGLIKRDSQDRWVQCDAVISTGDEVDSLNVINYHKQTLKKAEAIFDHCPKEQRDISGLTMGIGAEEFRLIKSKVQAFRKEIMKIAQNAKKADRVYQLNAQLFPMAIIKQGKKQ